MAVSIPPHRQAATAGSSPRALRRERFGGVRGNELLTRATAAVLLVLLAAEGVTVLSIEGLVRPHMFIGMVLIPPVLLKLGSAGYRFAMYYSGAPAYREKGPPALLLRVVGPVLVLATIGVFASGIWLMALGHGSDSVLSLHVASVVVFALAFGVHLLGHAPAVLRELRSDFKVLVRRSLAGSGARAALLAASLGGGLALALAVIGLITGWHGEAGG